MFLVGLLVSGYPVHRENRENGQKNPCQGKHREFGNFAKTPGKQREVCSLILKVKKKKIF